MPAHHPSLSITGQEQEDLTPDQQSRIFVAEGDRRGEDGDFTGALREYKKAARLVPTSRSLSRLAEGYAANDQPYKAIECYQRALHSHSSQDETPDLSEAHIGLGDLCCSFALSAAAIRSYERAVRSRPQNPYFRWKLAIALAAIGLYEKSAQQLQTVLQIAPDDAFYHFQMADVYLLMNRHADAIVELERTIALAPRDEYYRLRLGAALLQSNRCEEAIVHFECAVVLSPKNASYRVLLHYAHVRNGSEPEISLEVATLNLDPYDEDFVHRLCRLSE